MMKMSTGLRLYGVRNCPSIAMTATATENEIGEVVKALGLREKPVILTSSPVQAHIKFSIIRRPSNNFGLEGTIKKNGSRNPGLFDLLDRVYLRQYVQDIKTGVEPKKAIIFCRGNGVLGAIYSHLMNLTLNQFRDCRDQSCIKYFLFCEPKILSKIFCPKSCFSTTICVQKNINIMLAYFDC